MMKPISPCPRPAYRAAIVAAAMSGGLLLAACGGGGGGDSSPTPPPPPPPPPATATVSQADATADAANATASGDSAAASIDSVFDTTAALAAAVAGPTAASRTNAQGARNAQPQDGITTTKDVDLACAGGGTATVTIGGGTATSEHNGQFDAGETYTVTYAQCAGRAGLATLDGQVELDVTSVTPATGGVTPPAIAATVTLTGLKVTLPRGTIVADGSATISRSSLTAGTTTTTTSAIKSASLALTTQFNARSGSYAITNLDAVRVATTTDGTLTGTTYTGTHTLSGTANGRTFALTSATKGGATSFDANGLPTAGAWTVVRTDATIQAVLANGTVVLTIDQGSDGSVDATYTFPVATLEAAAG